MSGIRKDHIDSALAERLTTLPRFAGLSVPALSLLTSSGTARRLACGEQILAEGKPSRSLFIVLSGQLKMARALPSGRSAITGLLKAGDLVGISGLGGASDATVSAHRNSLCLEVPWAALLAALERQPRLLGEILPVFAERVAECRHCVLETAFYRVEPRIACLLLKLLESFGDSRSAESFVPVALSRQDLADMVGTSVETSIRIMSRWRKEGIVETREDGFVLRDKAALEAIGRQ